jgi:hypothetical protein
MISERLAGAVLAESMGELEKAAAFKAGAKEWLNAVTTGDYSGLEDYQGPLETDFGPDGLPRSGFGPAPPAILARIQTGVFLDSFQPLRHLVLKNFLDRVKKRVGKGTPQASSV